MKTTYYKVYESFSTERHVANFYNEEDANKFAVGFLEQDRTYGAIFYIGEEPKSVIYEYKMHYNG